VHPENLTTGEAPALPAPDDDRIRRLLAGRHPDGLQLLLNRYGASVRWWLRREYGQALSDVELDETLNLAAFAVWRSFRTFDPKRGTLRAWFYVIARRSAIGVMRREMKARTKPLPEDLDMGLLARFRRRSEPTDPPDEEQERFLAALRECVRCLARQQRAVIQADLQSEDVAETEALAEALGTSANAVYATRSMARKALRKCLKTKGHSFPPNGDGGRDG
jgi:RNA polymerase sigma factor (sigma-70 family)